MNSQLKADDSLYRSVFRDKNQKILELDEFLALI